MFTGIDMRTSLLTLLFYLAACKGSDDPTPQAPPLPEIPLADTGFTGTVEPTPPDPGPATEQCDEDDLVTGFEAPQPASSGSSGDEIRYGQGSSAFSSVAHVPPNSSCSSDYSQIDFCHNASNPPSPSLLRPVGTALRGYDDGVANRSGNTTETAASSAPSRRPAPGDTVVLPYEFQSADGRVLYSGNWKHYPTLGLFRPENLGYDLRLREDRAPASYPAAPSDDLDAISGLDQAIHTLALFDPQHTELRVAGRDADPHIRALLGNGQPNFLHTTVCEASSTRVEDDAIATYPCQARYGTFDAAHSDPTLREGLCYDLSVLGGAIGNSPGGEERWELRSSALTVFVPDAYTAQAGTSTGTAPGIWVYPRHPNGAPSPTGTHELPDYAAYDLHRLFPWNTIREGDAPDLADLGSECWNGAQPASGAPAWCAFLHHQEYNAQLRFDMDRDATPDRNSSALAYDGTSGPAAEALFEPITTADGRLLVLNSNLGVFYSTSDEPCSAEGFEHFLPYSLMPVDPEVRDHYPLAQTRITAAHPQGEPFRDPYGGFVPFGSIQRFAYPWIDRDGRNLFFAAMNEARDGWTTTQIEREWVDVHSATQAGLIDEVPLADPDADVENAPYRDHLGTRAGHSISVIGAWTAHKMVVVDNGLNAADFGGTFAWDRGSQYAQRFVLPLYQDAALAFVPMGTTILNSPENRLNHFDTVRPDLPFDVVWRMASNNQFDSQVAFDDWMSPMTFIAAPMNATAKILDSSNHRSGKDQSAFAIEDGFLPTGSVFDAAPGMRWNTAYRSASSTGSEGRPLLQNTAGRSAARLELRGGARIEPVALGGVLGRGVYLDGLNDHIRATYAAPGHRNWYLGVWLDDRSTDSQERVVFRFQDGWIALQRGASTEIVVRGATEQRVDIGELLPRGAWGHLGVRIADRSGARELDLFVDGTRIATLTVDGFDLDTSTSMRLGQDVADPAKTFQGWVDEWKVVKLTDEAAVAGTWFEEVACNHALGSLMDASHPDAAAITGRFTGFGPSAVCEQLVLESTDRPRDLAPQHERTTCASTVHHNGSSAACLRESTLEITSLVWDAPRPDAATTGFCTSCHDSQSQVLGLRPSALASHSLPRWRDRRRQPLDPPATLALPPVTCDADWTLDGTWYADVVQHQLSDGRYLTDPVLDPAPWFAPLQ